jgi:hypothetical protein
MDGVLILRERGQTVLPYPIVRRTTATGGTEKGRR